MIKIADPNYEEVKSSYSLSGIITYVYCTAALGDTCSTFQLIFDPQTQILEKGYIQRSVRYLDTIDINGDVLLKHVDDYLSIFNLRAIAHGPGIFKIGDRDKQINFTVLDFQTLAKPILNSLLALVEELNIANNTSDNLSRNGICVVIR